ncbi:cytosine deaminase [Oscillatoria sp. HE19RPO]|uniref:cytosine deaminase n=1 Tax=Oscillatoria sp. HE19RPO TaxID=2954806 RepID=UPI0020C33259|nr:cytosine deaminase [Oscillatoria sp. HE19RPO]
MVEGDRLILRDCCLLTGERVDIQVDEGTIAAIAPHLSGGAPRELNVQGHLVSPPFVESHIHLDSALTAGEPRFNQSGTLFEGIQIWGERKPKLTREDVKQRAVATLKQLASQGVLFVRTHVDVSTPDLTALQAMLEVREGIKEFVTLQVVAFPQDGIYGAVQTEELLEEALKLGADVVGGIPHYELTREDGVRSVHRIFELAQQYDRLIDIHCDEIDDDQSRFLEVVAACAIRSGLGERVTASHTTAFGSYNNAYAHKLMGFLRRSQINFVANPLINITLQGRSDTYPKRRGITRVKELWQQGLNVSLGQDCIQDPWYSLGTGNMLDVAYMALHVCQMTGVDEMNACYDMVTNHGAKTLQIEQNYGLELGKPANLIIWEAENKLEILRRRPPVRYVIARGKLLAQTQPAITTWELDNWGERVEC